ncbi:hypothetical protein EAX61_13030 [Dokdonia sinensis]|uniref:SGNH/GDSL hydrolase family protein n=1 Tax=Dokdonia sinensis TaxID=2479847 RepID=A0A3M0FWB9_9FLAO|nr:hypothetical protein EAX61_13030 [Dokdonia sinensis]
MFLVPVVLIYTGIEYLTRDIKNSQRVISNYLNEQEDLIEVLVLGASQNQSAVNPEYLDASAINLASGHQDYRTDFALLSQLSPRLPRLTTVVIPMTFAHLDTRPNPTNYWKNRGYFYYYGVNNWDRSTYFKDKLLFLSNPSYYTDQIERYYIDKIRPDYNMFGYARSEAGSAFAKADYQPIAIQNIPLSIRNYENESYRFQNLKHLKQILEFCSQKDIRIVVALTPVTQKHLKARNPKMVARRDSILNTLQKEYDFTILDKENAEGYELQDFANHNHLNSSGAEIFTQSLNKVIKNLN